MKFDRKAPGRGLEIITTVENGKAYLECKPHLVAAENVMPPTACLEIDIWDREGRLIFRSRYPLGQEEPIKGIILHPKLWQGVENAYLYRVQATLRAQEDVVWDVLERKLALRSLCEIPMKGWQLNGKPLEIRAVCYKVPKPEEEVARGEALRDAQIRRDLTLLKEMGANGIYLIGTEEIELLGQICDEMGLFIWSHDINREEQKTVIPVFSGTADSLVSSLDCLCTDRYYYYKACWSKEPFVYISMDSLKRQADGNARVVVYSNQKKVALYVDGVLFEFRNEGPDFVFEEIPVKQLPLLLTAETGECSMSVTVYPFRENR